MTFTPDCLVVPILWFFFTRSRDQTTQEASQRGMEIWNYYDDFDDNDYDDNAYDDDDHE